MGERKVLNKYYPPDFDHRLIPRGKKPKNAQMEVRMMLPFSIQCLTCGSFMYRGTKFNSKKEDVVGRDYLGITIFRFYGKCSTCGAQFSICTDPEKTDYSVESGVKRLFESWKMAREDEAQADAAHEAAEDADSMSRLEFMARDSIRQQDEIDALDDIRAQNARHERPVDPLATIDALHAQRSGASAQSRAEQAAAEDEAEIRAVRFSSGATRVASAEGSVLVHRLADSDSGDDAATAAASASSSSSSSTAVAAAAAAAPAARAAATAAPRARPKPRFNVRARKRAVPSAAAAPAAKKQRAEGGGGAVAAAAAAAAPAPASTATLLGIGDYSSSSDDD